MATIIIGADICPIEGNLPYFLAGDAPSLFHDLLPEFERADLVMANLECPLIERPSPIRKTGPVFGEGGACIEAIRRAGIDVLCLANNHILDHGAAGLEHTMQVCAAAGVATVGAGRNLAEAGRVLVREAAGLRIGILAMAEREFSIAGEQSWGANPLDLIRVVRTLREARPGLDYLVALVHGAHEFQPVTPRIRDTCRFLVEMGANAVIVQHSHCLGGIEEHRGGHIVYGQGALVMDEAIYRNLDSFHEGFLVRLDVTAPGQAGLDIVPFVQSRPVPGARRLTGQAETQFREALRARSEFIRDEEGVRAEWIRFCDERKHRYLSAVLGHNRWLRRLNTRGWLVRWLHGDRPLLGVRNILSCETHREALDTIFREGLLENSPAAQRPGNLLKP